MIQNRPRRNTGTIVNVYHPPPDGVKVYILVGKELVPEGTSSDLSCEIHYESQVLTTKSVKDDSAPYWDEAVRVLTKKMIGTLRIDVRNKVNNSVTGTAEMKLEEIPPMFDDWVRLHDNNGAYAGEVRITIANEIGLQ